MKRLISIFIVTVMVALLSSSIAFADVKWDKDGNQTININYEKQGHGDTTAMEVDSINSQILKVDADVQNLINIAVAQGDMLLSEYNSNVIKYPSNIAMLKIRFDLQINSIVNQLINKTDAMVNALIGELNKSGIIVEKYYVSVTIGNRVIDVDPCRTIGY